MRLGVLDVGSNTVHLLVVDAPRRGAPPLPAYAHKTELRLSEHLDDGGRVTEAGVRELERLIAEAVRIEEDQGCEATISLATSALREAPGGRAVVDHLRRRTGVELTVIPGEQEARLTFLAARRWFGWSSRRLLVLDIGGGSMEIATGAEENPDLARSLPLGAGRLTRDRLTGDPPDPGEVRELRSHIRTVLGAQAGEVTRYGPADHVVGTSKTFRRLARICGAAPGSKGPYVTRTLAGADLAELVPRLCRMSSADRAGLPGVSAAGAPQLLAGALVAEAALAVFEVDRVEICPWALREGVVLHYLDSEPAASSVFPSAVRRSPSRSPMSRCSMEGR